MTHRFAEEPAGYFAGPYAQKYLKMAQAEFAEHDADPLDLLDYPAGMLKARFFIPDNYRAKDADDWGVYLHIHSGDRAPLPAAWKPVLASRKMIYVAPWQAGNQVHPIQRMAVTLDALATAQAALKFNPRRVVVGGLSGGGATALSIALDHPQRFAGVLSHARNYMLDFTPMPEASAKRYGDKIKWKPGMGWPREPQHLDDDDLRQIAKAGLRVVFITGEKDFNHEPTLRGAAGWVTRGFALRILDVPGMGHTVADAEAFDTALGDALGDAGVPGDVYAPRYALYDLEPPRPAQDAKPREDAEDDGDAAADEPDA